MTNTWQEYQNKSEEIKKYFFYIKNNESLISSDLLKILKANLFLMLYNLVESCIRNSLEEIHNAITNENISYNNTIDEIKALWIEYNYKKFTQKNATSITETINNIAIDKIIIDYSDYITKTKNNDISGNIDGQKIRKIADKYCIEKNRRVNGYKLLIIKNTRNRLAHGEVTFSEIGQNYSLNELDIIRKECKIYLKEFLINVENYINLKKFIKT